jgi:hypothetical protein
MQFSSTIGGYCQNWFANEWLLSLHALYYGIIALTHRRALPLEDKTLREIS